MGVEQVPVEVTVSCDGPDCIISAVSTDAADPTPTGWLKVWSTISGLGIFYFHNGACYDNWAAANESVEQ